jgi:hypothetical protein
MTLRCSTMRQRMVLVHRDTRPSGLRTAHTPLQPRDLGRSQSQAPVCAHTCWRGVEKGRGYRRLPGGGRVCSGWVGRYQQNGAQDDWMGRDPGRKRRQRGQGRNAGPAWWLSTGWVAELSAHRAESISCAQELGNPSGDSGGGDARGGGLVVTVRASCWQVGDKRGSSQLTA